MASVFDMITSLLDSHSIAYEIIEHEPVYTSEQAAEVRGTPLHAGAKAMVMWADKRAILVVLPADRRIDTRRFKSSYKVKDLRLANPEEVERLTGLTVGAIPPFGNLLGLPTHVDRSLLGNHRIAFNAGLHTRSIVMSPLDYIGLIEAEVGDFS